MRNRQTNSYFTIKAASAAFIVLYILSGCYSKSSRAVQSKQHVQLIVNYPLVQLPGPKVTELPDTIQYYYYDNYVAVGLPIRQSVENSERILQQSIFHSWFIFSRDSTYGYFFDSVKAGTSKRLKVDSVLFNRAYATKFDLSKDTLVEKIRDKETGILQEKYTPKHKYGEFYFDSLFYYYSPGMQHVKYSLSKNIDSIKNLKLFKVRLCYNERYSPSQGMVIPKREFSFEIRELPFRDIGFVNLINQIKGLNTSPD